MTKHFGVVFRHSGTCMTEHTGYVCQRNAVCKRYGCCKSMAGSMKKTQEKVYTQIAVLQ